MRLMGDVLENALIERLASSFPRSPLQYNKLQESDSELVRLPGGNSLLAVTTDGVVEEIESGLYDDPYLIGWMTVIVNASDLAAVGAEPLGILINENLPHGGADDFISKLQEGIRDASAATGLYVLGGDTNVAPRLELGGTAVGLIPDGVPLTRVGCRPGDLLFGSGPFGRGGAYSFTQFVGKGNDRIPPVTFKPPGRLREGMTLRGLASCCMDTSDGLLTSLDQLMRLNSVGFTIDQPEENFIDNSVIGLSSATGLASWMALAGPHGEFELVFTVPAERGDELSARAAAIGWQPVPIGRAVADLGVWLREQSLDVARMRNMFSESEGDVGRYFAGLLEMAAGLKTGGNRS